MLDYLNSVNICPIQSQEIVMKNVLKTQAKLPKFLVATACFALASTAIGGKARALEVIAGSPTARSATVSYPVRYSDLDVSKMKDAKTLYLRIRYAAETLCESAASWGKKEGQACVNRAVNDAVARVNAPLLTQYNQQRSKGEKAGLEQFAKAN
jgi:UrcA family protein